MSLNTRVWVYLCGVVTLVGSYICGGRRRKRKDYVDLEMGGLLTPLCAARENEREREKEKGVGECGR